MTDDQVPGAGGENEVHHPDHHPQPVAQPVTHDDDEDPVDDGGDDEARQFFSDHSLEANPDDDPYASPRLDAILDKAASDTNREEAARQALLAAIDGIGHPGDLRDPDRGDSRNGHDSHNANGGGRGSGSGSGSGFRDDHDDEDDDSEPAVVFNFISYERAGDHPLFYELERWVRWLVWHFELGEIVPPCWEHHDGIIEEMAALYEGWVGIYTAGAKKHHALDQLTWLGHLDSSLMRVATKWDRSGCGPRGVHEDKTRSVWPDMAAANRAHPLVISALVGMTTGDDEPF